MDLPNIGRSIVRSQRQNHRNGIKKTRRPRKMSMSGMQLSCSHMSHKKEKAIKVILAGGFKDFLFSALLGEDFHFD